MTIGADKSYSGQSKIYRKQQPAGTTINGGTVVTEEVVDNGGGLMNFIGELALNSAPLPMYATVTIAPTGAGGSTKCRITFTVKDGNGNAITGVPFHVHFTLSDAATGVGLTGTSPSGGIAVSTGTQLSAMVAAKALIVESDTNGVVAVDITDAGTTGYYAVLQLGGVFLPVVSRQLTAADYS